MLKYVLNSSVHGLVVKSTKIVYVLENVIISLNFNESKKSEFMIPVKTIIKLISLNFWFSLEFLINFLLFLLTSKSFLVQNIILVVSYTNLVVLFLHIFRDDDIFEDIKVTTQEILNRNYLIKMNSYIK
jgi:hypothetical protein